MQTQGGSDAEVAVTAPERKFHHRFLVDWNRNGSYNHALSDMSKYVDSARTDRSLSGSAPQSLTLVGGAAAAELTISIGGQYTVDYSVADIFSPYQANSPFWGMDIVGVECTFEIGLETAIGIVWYPQFVGNIRTITPDRGDFSVEIRALDRVELLRRPVKFPKWAMIQYQAVNENSVVSQLCDSQWVIDHCLRKSGISPTPSRPMTPEEKGLPDNDPTRCQVWVSGTGSYLPTHGFLDNWNIWQFPNDDADFEMYTPYGAQHPSTPSIDKFPQAFSGVQDGYGKQMVYWSEDREKINPGALQILGFTLITNPDAEGSQYYLTAPDQMVQSVEFGDNYYGEIWIGAGQVWGRWRNRVTLEDFSTSRVNVPAGVDYVKVNFVVDAFHASGLRAWVGAGSNQTGASWSILATPRTFSGSAWDYKGYCTVVHRVPLNDIYYTGTNFGSGGVTPQDWAGQYGSITAEYCAVLDSGANRFSYMPVVDVDDAWELMRDVASAEFGSIFWDESGVFRFWNYGTIQMLQNDPVRSINLDQLTGLRFTNWSDSIRNIITVDATDRRSFSATVFEQAGEWDFVIPSGTRKEWRISVSDMQTHSPETPPRYETIVGSFPTWVDSVIHGYIPQWLHLNGSYFEDDSFVSGLDIDQWIDFEGNLVISIYNGYAETARLWADVGHTGLRIGGTTMGEITEKTYTYKDVTSANKYGGRNLQLSGPWYQEFHNQMGGISQLLAVTKDPVPDTENITLAGDPRIQLGDTFRVSDPEGFGARFDMQVFGITRTYDVQNGLSDTYAVKLINTPGGIWDDNQYGIWGSTFIWGN
jgi:hypothetical protein